VAARCGFAYYVVNQEEAFSRRVLDYFVDEYRSGRTPNPCARCNADVKFMALSLLARDLGAEAVATGHYARLERSGPEAPVRLRRARDRRRDQSYFLFDVEPDHLARAIFPLGELEKEAVRAEARRLGLRCAEKPDSQDVCFVEGRDYRDFLRERADTSRPEPAGDIVDREGALLGHHEGVSGFTVGQRRGAGVAAGRRLYVLQVDAPSATVVMGEREDLLCAGLSLTSVRAHAAAGASFAASVQVRYRHAGAAARVTLGPDGVAEVELLEPVAGVSPGQAAVFYEGDVVLGGGWIAATRASGSRCAGARPSARAQGAA
jgi:tRNA-specific 2-thiouridylase